MRVIAYPINYYILILSKEIFYRKKGRKKGRKKYE